MIQSMTRQERKDPDVLDKSRIARIARGCGRQQKDVNALVKRFYQMRDMMGKLGAEGAENLLSRMPGMDRLAGAGGMDPGMLGGFGGDKAPRGAQKKKGAEAARKKKRKQARASRKKRRK